MNPHVSPAAGPTDELVVLVDDDGRAIGTAAKHSVHHRDTPLHLAFSCYLFDADGSLLVTQRALHKRTWPGVWTNSCCGHPAPGEPNEQAIARRVREELGLAVSELRLVLPRFRYLATMGDGTRENELCPVYVARVADRPDPDPEEVEATSWVPWPEFRETVLDGSRDVSPWCREQVAQLAASEDGEGWFRSAPASDLPPAARGAAGGGPARPHP